MVVSTNSMTMQKMIKLKNVTTNVCHTQIEIGFHVQNFPALVIFGVCDKRWNLFKIQMFQQ